MDIPLTEQAYTNWFIPVCHCGISEHWVVDPFGGRIFCFRCKVWPTLQAIPEGEIEKYKREMMRGYFVRVSPQQFTDDIKELKERYASLPPEDSSVARDTGGFEHLFDPEEGSKSSKKRKGSSGRNPRGKREGSRSPNEDDGVDSE